jgi:protein-disulfide isomerase
LCAKVQGKFWEMHDRLFAHQDALGDEALVGHAVAVGLDPAKFKTCLKSDKHDAQIATDVATALSVGARGTPNSFVNGRQLDGARPFDLFKELIDEELEKAQALLREGVKPENLYREIIAKGRSLPQLGEAQASFSDAGSPTLGDWENAPMKVTVFSDFQCPYCARVAPMMEEVQRRLGWKVAIKFRHFPLSVHQEARPAARASQCAHKQGRFWDFHDELFGHQELLGAELFEQTARKLKLDMKAFEACLTEAGTNAVVDRDMEEARKAGLKGTPNIYVNGREVEFAQMDAAAFERLSEKYFKDAIARVRSRSAKNACHKWLRCLGDLAKVGKKNARKLTAVANTLRAAAEQGNKGVLAACRAGLSVAIQSFPGPAPESCE